MTSRQTLQAKFAFVLAALLMIACGGNNNEPSPADNGKDRQEILTHWVQGEVRCNENQSRCFYARPNYINAC
jgi:hypothetical protein